MKKVLITGGAGYVGSLLTPFLLKKGYKITVLDLMIYGKSVIEEHKNLKIFVGDIRDQNLLKKILPNHDAIIHLACISNDPSFELNPSLGKSINLDAFEPLLKIAQKSQIKRFINASSSSVYGIKSEKNVNEEMSLKPLTDYSKYKVDCEEILKKYNCPSFCTVTLRPATVCGYSPRQRLDVIVNILTNLAFHKREISIFGGKQLRPNIHIKDMIRAYELLLSAKDEKISGKIFNIGFENKSVKELAEIVKNKVGDDVQLKMTETNDNRSYHISSEKIKRELNFVCKYNIADAVEDLVVKFKENIFDDPLTNEKYFNIKTMKKLNLK